MASSLKRNSAQFAAAIEDFPLTGIGGLRYGKNAIRRNSQVECSSVAPVRDLTHTPREVYYFRWGQNDGAERFELD